jgi:ferritin-like metal-binding protein YciE
MSKERLVQIRNELRSLQAQLFDYRQVVYRLEELESGLRAEYQTLDRQLAEQDGRKKVIKLTPSTVGNKKPITDSLTDKAKSLNQDQINKLIEELGKL